MSTLSLGIVGLPNVGKSTLFNALVKNGQAVASNYPFCTIDPNVGVVEVPDSRLIALADLVHPERIVPAVVEFTDIAGIIKGASQGEGLGNTFLNHIRETKALVLVTRFFDDADVVHVAGSVNPKSDLETILIELMLADLSTVEKARDRYAKQARSGDKEALVAHAFIERLHTALSNQTLASRIEPTTEGELLVLRDLHLLTSKPLLVVANVAEQDISIKAEQLFTQHQLDSLLPSADWLLPLSAKIEAELAQLPANEQTEFLHSYGMTESGMHRLVRQAYDLLGLATYFTAGPQEVRAWTIPKHCTAPEAAGVIHTDFQAGFIRAEVIAYADYLQYKGEQGAKEAGKLRLEGKEYSVQDGDVLHFRFSK
jgi:ribosome-binding ATPase